MIAGECLHLAVDDALESIAEAEVNAVAKHCDKIISVDLDHFNDKGEVALFLLVAEASLIYNRDKKSIKIVKIVSFSL
jgi:hypothetical protein